jgi:mono/diheme cytochrome c family protein
MKSFVLGFVSTVILVPVVAVCVLKSGLAEVRADANAPTWQAGLFHLVERASVRRRAAGLQIPSPGTDADLAVGRKLYFAGCAGCHGGPDSRPRKRPVFLPPPLLWRDRTRYSEAELYWVIKHGLRRTGMSAYGPSYSERELWALAAFVHRMRDLPPSLRETIRQGR